MFVVIWPGKLVKGFGFQHLGMIRGVRLEASSSKSMICTERWCGRKNWSVLISWSSWSASSLYIDIVQNTRVCIGWVVTYLCGTQYQQTSSLSSTCSSLSSIPSKSLITSVCISLPIISFVLISCFTAWNDKAQLLLWPVILVSLAAITNPLAIRSLALCVMIKTIFWIGVQNALVILGIFNVSCLLILDGCFGCIYFTLC